MENEGEKERETGKYQRKRVRKRQGNDDVEWVEGYELEKEAIQEIRAEA